MKKILMLSALVALFAISASAQRGDRVRSQKIEKGFDQGRLTRGEKFKMKKNEVKLNAMKRKAFRDGKLSRSERKQIAKMRKHNRSAAFRAKHNHRKRVM
jgi:hypothetical protein